MESSARPLVNGAFLGQFVGHTVTLFGTVISVERTGKSFDLMSSDKHVVTVALRTPLTEPLTGLVEVHGIVKGKNNVICNYYLSIPGELAANYDLELVDDTVNLLHNTTNVWKAAA
ncbi:Replication factor A protein 3 [Nesidiocoris tenuis]|uniref:Replication factor A protein 3 n=1 Tax=Nesidiocoris tenuis TaxID=355587 RepID=A0ABN7AVZ5_9HEMI|nr:Replication factor A protein 3 [Nesidiocoris tenuis]